MPWVNGAALAVRLESLYDIGVMDENYFLFCSDADWCYTARARGWEVWYCATADCIHETGVSTHLTAATQKYLPRDQAYWCTKWAGSELHRRGIIEFGLSGLNFVQ